MYYIFLHNLTSLWENIIAQCYYLDIFNFNLKKKYYALIVLYLYILYMEYFNLYYISIKCVSIIK